MSDETESELRGYLCSPENALQGIDRMMVPKTVRLQIPLLNRFLLRETGHLIAGFGQRLYAITQDNGSERHILLEAVWHTRDVQRRIADLRKGRNQTPENL